MTQRGAPYLGNPAFGLAALALLATAALTAPARAVILEEFLFNETAGTLLSDGTSGVTSNINAGVFFDADPGDTDTVATNGLGQLDASLKNNTEFGTNYIDIDPGITTGTVFGVIEMTWDFQSTFDPGEPEEVRLSLINSDPRSTQITSDVRIRRTSAGIEFLGQAGSTSQSEFHVDPTLLNGGSLTQATKFIGVVATDLDNESYEIFYSTDAGGSFTSGGSAPFPAGRGVESMRLTLNNNLFDDNVLIDRIYLTDEFDLTVTPPDELKLYVHPVSGHMAIVNETGTEFEIDDYRIGSGDGSLLEPNWRSLQDQAVDAVDGPDGGSTAGDGVGETWTEAGGSDSGVLRESFLLSSSIVSAGETLPLGRVFDLAGDAGQLTFEYRDPVTGAITEAEVVVMETVSGDFNLDGVVNAADYTVFRDDSSGLFVPANYTEFSSNYADEFTVASATATPEPTAALLLLMGGAVLASRRR